MQTSRIAELYNSMSQYQRASYAWTDLHTHVIITGELTYGSIVDFCREYYVSDPNGHVVIAKNEEPSLEVRRLLNHPFYRNRIFYLRGEITSLRDLRRFKSGNATALFLFNDKLNKSPEDSKVSDTAILMQSLKVKNWEAGIPIFAQIHDTASLELAQCCGCDRVLCIEEIKVSLMARNCLVPGMMTLLTNLVNTYPDVSDDESAEFWRQEYQNGVGNQIQSFRIPKGLVGVLFPVASKILYHEFGGTLFAVMSATAGFNNSNVRLNPGADYKLKESDIGLFIADTNENVVPMILYQFRDAFKWENMGSSFTSQLSDVDDIVKTVATFEGEDEKAIGLSTVSLALSRPIEETSSNEPAKKDGSLFFQGAPENLYSHLIICGCTSLDYLLSFIITIRTSGMDRNHAISSINAHQETPIVIVLDSAPDQSALWKSILEQSGIYIVIGRSTEIKTLREASIESCKRVVIFADQTLQDAVAADSSSILVIKLMKKNWPKVQFLVEMLDGSSVRFFSRQDYEWDTRNLKMQAVLNNYELQIPDRLSKYLAVRSESTDNSGMLTQIIRFLLGEPTEGGKKQQQKRLGKDTAAFQSLEDEAEGQEEGSHELVKKKPSNKVNDTSISGQYFQRLLEEVELNESGLSAYPVYHFDRHFAAGMVSISSSMHSLLCQSYFRPFIIDVVKALSAQLIHLRVPVTWSGRDYGDFYDYCMDRGYILIGLYRHGSKEAQTSERLEIPFVSTNPRAGDTVSSEDLVFAIKQSAQDAAR